MITIYITDFVFCINIFNPTFIQTHKTQESPCLSTSIRTHNMWGNSDFKATICIFICGYSILFYINN